MTDITALQLDPDERIIKKIRRSAWGVVGWVAGIILIVIFMLAALYLLSRYRDQLSDTSATMLLIFIVALAIFAMLFFYIHVRIFFLNSLVITNESVIQRLQTTLFNPKTSQLRLDDVQDVTLAQNGLLANLFNFGTVTVETAGEQVNFVFTYAKDPQAAARAIIEAQEELAQQPQKVEHTNGPTATG